MVYGVYYAQNLHRNPMHIPPGLTGRLIIIALVAGLLSLLLYGLRHALTRLKIAENRRRRLLGFTLAGLICWLAILGVLAFAGFFRNFQALPPRLLLAVFPPLIAILALFFSRKMRLLLLAVPPGWLLYAQTFRILMELFLWLGYRGGFVPPQMTFEWLNYDIIVGLTAPIAGFVFFGRGRFRRFEAVLWNIFGVALLLNIVLISMLSTPSPLRIFMNDPPNTFVAEFPFVWIPGFIVPFALALHLFSLKQLLFARPVRRQFRLRR